MVKLAVGSDHGGLLLKRHLCAFIEELGIEFHDFGTYSPEPVDYPDIARQVAEAVVRGECERGLLVCGTGIGMAIAANKLPGIRAALCHDTFSAVATREHNNSNILCLGERVIGPGLACVIFQAWWEGKFRAGRHARRVEKIAALEREYGR
jgi:ribose 5-phosphate isomerase B